jgi:signal transduction histidine kinase
MPPKKIAKEIFDQLRRKSTLFRLIAIFTLTAVLGVISARFWARSHFNTVAHLLEIQHGYEGVSIGYSGFGSLLISLVERRGIFFVKNLDITRDREILQRVFYPPNRLKYLDLWPANLSLARTVDDLHVRIGLIMSSWVLAQVFFISLVTTAIWLVVTAWLELLGREKLEIALAEKISAQARQVAHDIRSPVAALEVASEDAANLPEETRRLIRSAIGRIHGIADSLLDRQRALAPESEPAVSPLLLANLIEPVIGEKRLQFRAQARVKIELSLGETSRGLTAAVESVEFQRLLSNLVNNAVEAFDEHGGTVTVSLSANEGRALIKVRDDGKGISPDILSKLGRRGETHGKASGTGLGLFHARTKVESWGGTLELSSELGKGTTAALALPLADDPARTRLDAVLIDDDPLSRATWKLAAARASKSFRSFASVEDFFIAAEGFDRSTSVYIDSDLGDGVKGERVSVKIHAMGFGEIYLATGHPPEKFTGLAHLRGVVGKKTPWT